MIIIPPSDRIDASEPLRLLVTKAPRSLHPRQEWARVEGIELDADGATLDLPITVIVRAVLLTEVTGD